MDFYNIPIGFGMALAMNPPAFNAYSNLTEEEKDVLLALWDGGEKLTVFPMQPAKPASQIETL